MARLKTTSLPTLSCLLALVLSASAWASTSISGKAKGYENKDVFVFYVGDELSERLVYHAETKVADDGSFSLSIPTTKIRRVQLRIGRISAYHFVRPKTNYTVVFPQYPDDEPLAFHKQNLVALQLIDTDSTDVNLLNDEFNAHYDAFTAEHYLTIAQEKFKGGAGYKRSQQESLRKTRLTTEEDTVSRSTSESFYALVDAFEKQELAWLAKQPTEALDDKFLKQSINYACGVLKLSAGLKKTIAYEQYLKGQPVNLHHPDYVAFVAAMYGNQLTEITDEYERHPLTLAINQQRSWEAVSTELAKYDIMQDEQHRALATCAMIKQSFGNKAYSKNAFLGVLNGITSVSASTQLDSLPLYLAEVLRRGMKGAPVGNFTLYDHKLNKVTFSEYSVRGIVVSSGHARTQANAITVRKV